MSELFGLMVLSKMHRAEAERDAALAEAARLREALEEIGRMQGGTALNYADMARTMRGIARAALAKEADSDR